MAKADTTSLARNSGGAIPFGYMTLIAVLTACGLYAAFIVAPEERAVAQQQLAQEIADENRAFCETFGMRGRTDEFRACSEQLAIIRHKQADRDRAAEAGIL
ncbi:hypothetical protein J2R96_006298 [Bradyrhizobium elkanii]|uniref:Uncharacterized protein n=1 Tax=Bradyrhizobium brasilense TaxID=1419277 RepID=A0ABY8JKM6_9BRAD|nr:hypothetical protein [Bradyrhizobium brasilense]MCP1913818.1 hypothetical protein [Bradyrhizobium elkanii]WFU66189.1 hypothetical protein QA636_12015 [Bradyrhizobium brasilense]